MLVVGQGRMRVVGILRQLLARIPKVVVRVKGAVTANGTVEIKGVIPLELSILSWLLDGITKERSLVTDLGGMCMCWGEGMHEDPMASMHPAQQPGRTVGRSQCMHALGVNFLKSIAMRVWYFTRDSALSGSYTILAEEYWFHVSSLISGGRHTMAGFPPLLPHARHQWRGVHREQ